MYWPYRFYRRYFPTPTKAAKREMADLKQYLIIAKKTRPIDLEISNLLELLNDSLDPCSGETDQFMENLGWFIKKKDALGKEIQALPEVHLNCRYRSDLYEKQIACLRAKQENLDRSIRYILLLINQDLEQEEIKIKYWLGSIAFLKGVFEAEKTWLESFPVMTSKKNPYYYFKTIQKFFSLYMWEGMNAIEICGKG